MPEVPAAADRPVLWLVRHGQTEWSAADRYTSRTDVPLTEAGEEEAMALRPWLAGQELAFVVSSPRQRAVRTAGLAGFEPVIDPDLAEWDYGNLEGLTAEEIRAQHPGWTIWEGPWTDGERPQDVAARARRAIERARALPAGATALMFSHGHMLRVITMCWLGRPVADGAMLGLGTATIGVLGWDHDLPVVQRWNMPTARPTS